MITLRVPFDDLDRVRQLGAKWNASAHVWYVPRSLQVTPFKQWIPTGADAGKMLRRIALEEEIHEGRSAPVNRVRTLSSTPGAIRSRSDRLLRRVSIDVARTAETSKFESGIFGAPNEIKGQMALFLNVPYAEKDQAKALDAKWDADRKIWYVPEGVMATQFEEWLDSSSLTDAASVGLIL